MALKDLVSAGEMGAGLAGFCKLIAALANQYSGPQGPLAQLLATYQLPCQLADNPAHQAAVDALLADVVLPTAEEYATATAGRFTTEDEADADGILAAAAVLTYVAARLAAKLPLNDV